jgi:pimeloyl-ACP methyl ester carboxylesterase
MPFATHRGQQIHYTVEGEGPLVVFQHGFFSNAMSWKQSGAVDALTDGYQVACIDSLGHGLSDKPTDPSLYGWEQRAGDIAAVIDDLGCKRAHLVGYSMGGWLAVGMAKYHPERLSSLVIGGWNAVEGAPQLPSLDAMIEQVAAIRPDLVEWIRPEFKPGLQACQTALAQIDGSREAILAVGCPTMLWNGREDAPHDPMRAFADANGLRFLSTRGDHSGARTIYAAEGSQGIRAFLDDI